MFTGTWDWELGGQRCHLRSGSIGRVEMFSFWQVSKHLLQVVLGLAENQVSFGYVKSTMPIRLPSGSVEYIVGYKTLEFLLKFLNAGIAFSTDFLLLRYINLSKINMKIGGKDFLHYHISNQKILAMRSRWNHTSDKTNHWVLRSLVPAGRKYIFHLESWDIEPLVMPLISCL